MENENTETAYNCRQFPYINFKWQNVTKTCVLQWRTDTETAYNCRQFPYLNFKLKNAKKQAFCNGKPEYGIVGSFRISILSGKTPQKRAFCNGGHGYGNCLQL